MIITYEQDELNTKESLFLFSELIKSGLAWKLQGHYGRTAQSLINQELIFKNGDINTAKVNRMLWSE